jgi:hypothetical protein
MRLYSCHQDGSVTKNLVIINRNLTLVSFLKAEFQLF